MNANGQRFWMLAEEAHWSLAGENGLGYNLEPRPLSPGGISGEGWGLGRPVRDRELEVQVARVAGVNSVIGINLFEQDGEDWRLLPRPQAFAPVEIHLEAWQLPELLATIVLVDEENGRKQFWKLCIIISNRDDHSPLSCTSLDASMFLWESVSVSPFEKGSDKNLFSRLFELRYVNIFGRYLLAEYRVRDGGLGDR